MSIYWQKEKIRIYLTQENYAIGFSFSNLLIDFHGFEAKFSALLLFGPKFHNSKPKPIFNMLIDSEFK